MHVVSFLVCYDINNKPVYLGSKVKLNLKVMGEGDRVVEGIVCYDAKSNGGYAAFYVEYLNPDFDSSKPEDNINNEKLTGLIFYPEAIELITS